MDRRAVSSALTYSLVVVITVTMTAGLVIGTESLVEDQREDAVRDQLDVVGQQLAATMMTVDRFTATESEPVAANVTRQFPNRVAGSQYRVNVTALSPDTGRSAVVLESRDFDVTVTVPVRNATALQTASPVNGGRLRVAYDPEDDRIEVEHA